jgi:hypothetical protein
MKNEPTASLDGAGNATWTALLAPLPKYTLVLVSFRLSIVYIPWLPFGDPEIRRFPLLLTETYIVVMPTNKLISKWL